MAKVEKRVEEVTKVVTTEETVVALTLTEEEATALRAVLGMVGGPIKGHRKNVDTIYRALDKEVGYTTEVGQIQDAMRGNIMMGGLS